MLEKKTFVLAVSGGVDSVVLLHKLTQNQPDGIDYVVAHYDHGIREDSSEDAEFVRSLAKKQELQFELGEGKLGKYASEQLARYTRYDFLRSIAKKHNAEKIITAHHQDDLIETMIINILRGTSPRGLAPMKGQSDLLRPLMNSSKSQLIKYANEHNLEWREDPTNMDEKYLRNYVRLNIMPKLENSREELMSINRKIDEIYHDIDTRMAGFLYGKKVIPRPWLVSLPYSVQKEFIYAWLVRMNIKDIDKTLIERLALACKTLPIGKKVDVVNGVELVSEKENLHFSSR